MSPVPSALFRDREPDLRDRVAGWGIDCPLCGHGSALVAPDCPDGHGVECPDRLCLACGAALFVDPPTAQRRASRMRRGA